MASNSEGLTSADLYAQMEPGYLYTAPRDMPGFRIESVHPSNGSIGTYGRNGLTPEAVCHSTPLRKPTPSGPRFAPAFHTLPCSCGYRIVTDTAVLYDFVELVTRSPLPGSMGGTFTNHAFSEAVGDTSGLALVTCSIPKGTTLTTRNLDDQELPGTYRATRLKFEKTVHMPRRRGRLDQTELARKVQQRYGVKVKIIEGDGLDFMDSLKSVPAGSGAGTGDGWHACGEWGLYGAAGVLFMTGRRREEEKYLITRRSSSMPNHPGLWGTPGGAIGRGESTLQGATREVHEELNLPGLGGASIAGAVDYVRPGGWEYTTYLAYVPEPFEPSTDGRELTEHRWVSKRELERMAIQGKLIPAFAEKLFELFELHRTWRSVMDRPRGHTLGGWRL